MNYNQNQPQVAYPPPGSQAAELMMSTSTAPAYTTAPPPPAGYPTRDADNNVAAVPVKTQSRGDGFWKGCCAALCCCCVLDACF